MALEDLVPGMTNMADAFRKGAISAGDCAKAFASLNQSLVTDRPRSIISIPRRHGKTTWLKKPQLSIEWTPSVLNPAGSSTVIDTLPAPDPEVTRVLEEYVRQKALETPPKIITMYGDPVDDVSLLSDEMKNEMYRSITSFKKEMLGEPAALTTGTTSGSTLTAEGVREMLKASESAIGRVRKGVASWFGFDHLGRKVGGDLDFETIGTENGTTYRITTKMPAPIPEPKTAVPATTGDDVGSW